MKDKYHMISPNKWNLINKTNKQNITKDIEIKNKLNKVNRGEEEGE